MRSTLLTLTLVSSLSALAHTSGHGPLVKGVGPNKGKLSAVISAAEAEKGRDAKAVYYAETRVEGPQVTWTLLDTARKPFTKSVTAPAKFIVFFENEAKPAVVSVAFEKGQATLALDPTKKLKSGEVIVTFEEGTKYVGDLAL